MIGMLSGAATRWLLYIIAALAVLALGLYLYAGHLDNKLEVANAASSSAMSLARSYQTEKDAWKLRAEELTASVAAHQQAMGTLADELHRAQEDAVTLRQQDAAALAQARAELAEANRTLAGFVDRYHAQVRAPACEQALNRLEAACPALSDY